MNAVAETKDTNAIRHNDRDSGTVGRDQGLAEAYRRWSVFGMGSRREVGEALTRMLQSNRRVEKAVQALLPNHADASSWHHLCRPAVPS